MRWLGEQLDTDAEAARAADVKEGDPAWWVSPVLADGDAYTVRSERDNAPIARVRRLYGDDGHTVVLDGRAVAEHIAANDPARVLREIDAKRRTLIRCQEEMMSGIPRLVHFAKQTAWEMAQPYSSRPGYRELEWRP